MSEPFAALDEGGRKTRSLDPERIARGDQRRAGGSARIRCPACRWQPTARDRWLCTPCGHVWNTFDTHGVCPGCGHRWKTTQCPSCHRVSPHEDWYERAHDA